MVCGLGCRWGNTEQYNTGMLICVNTIRTYTEAHIEVPSGGPTDWQDYYTVGAYPVVDGIIRIPGIT
jgi:hypothetical protein